MTAMRHLIGRYIAHRRRLGYQLRGVDTLLSAFARFCEQTAPGQPLSTKLAVRWAHAPSNLRPKTRAGRLGIVRGFARYCAALDPRNEIPPFGLLATRFSRRAPHIFAPGEIRLILRRARSLQDRRAPLHAHTYATLIGLLACTGMRPGEAIRLRLGDFNASAGSARIAPCKFSPERIIPLHPSCVRALNSYRQARLRAYPFGENFFTAAHGHPLTARRTEKVFRKLAEGIASGEDGRLVRLYDFRHTFATTLIARWSRQARPVAHHLILLSRYLGHGGFNSTWWYVSGEPRSLQCAASRFWKFHKSSPEK